MSEQLVTIAKIHTPFSEKFGIPRQSGLVPGVMGEIHFEPQYRSWDAVRGIDEYSYLWLLWGFSESKRGQESLTVAPPRLGGRERKGIFATRAPYRPNGIGLSSVRLTEVCKGGKGEPVLIVSGADLLDGTPIYDIKPYLPYTDAHPDAQGGFGETHHAEHIPVLFPEELRRRLPEELRESAYEVLAQDPRAAYNKKPEYVYGLRFAEYDLRFTVRDGVLMVEDVTDARAGFSKIK